MGITLNNDALIAGYRPAMFKNALRGYLRTQNPGSLIDLRSVFPLRRDGAIVFEECLDRGWIDPETYKVTEHGETLAYAKARARTALAKADAVLEDFLNRADAMNADVEAIGQVDQVWLFGSLLRREETVGDIDVALVTSRKARFAADHAARQKHADAQMDRHDDAPDYRQFPWQKEGWLLRRALYGRRRHALLAGIQNGTTDLEALGVPCRLIYDRTRGGRVQDPILKRHPKSSGRASHVRPPAELPEVAPAPLRPMDGRWVAAFSSRGDVSPYDIFRGWTDEAHRLFPNYPRSLRVLGSRHRLDDFPWNPRSVRRSDLDGRAMLAIVDATPWWGLSVVLQRRIDTAPDLWTLRLGFTDAQLHRTRKYVQSASLNPIVAVISLIAAVDAERMARRAAELPAAPKVAVHISSAGLSEELRKRLAGGICEALSSRAIYIEPPGWGHEVAVALD